MFTELSYSIVQQHLEEWSNSHIHTVYILYIHIYTFQGDLGIWLI